MEIKEIQYEGRFDLHNGDHEKLRLRAAISDETNLKDAFEKLRQQAIDCAQPDPQKVWNERRKLERELRDLQAKVEEARKNWETAANFLTSQGIKTEMPNFPQFANLLPSTVTEVEMIDF